MERRWIYRFAIEAVLVRAGAAVNPGRSGRLSSQDYSGHLS